MTTKTAPKPAKATAKAAKTTLLYQATKGDPHPLGSTVYPDGVNFSVFSQNAASMELLLFAEGNSTEPFQIIKMTDEGNKSFHFWHIFLVDAKPGLHYAYRVHGPEEKKPGHRFTPEKVLIDPYAYGNSMDLWNRGAACLPGDNLTQSMRSVLAR